MASRNSAYSSDKIRKNRKSSEAKAKATANNLSSRSTNKQEQPKHKPKPKPKPKPEPTTKTKPTPPTNRGAGNGAPGASSAVTRPQAERKKVRGGNNKDGRTSRLEDALASVKKYNFKKKK